MSIKGYELMRLAKENPEKYEGKRYKVVKGIVLNKNGGCFYYEVVVYNGEIVIAANKNHSALIDSSTELEEIKQPVTPQEAAKSFSEGKTIRCEYIDSVIMFKKDTPSRSFTPDYYMKLMLEGTWYIEE